MKQACNRGLAAGNVTARAAEATARHLSVLEKVYAMMHDEAKAAIRHVRNVSEKVYFYALADVARNKTVRATEMNLAAMEGRLNGIRARVRDSEAVQIALQQIVAIDESGEKISQRAQETGINITSVEELMTRATYGHLQVLAEIYDKVPEQAKQAMERAMDNLMIRYQKRVQALEQRGVEAPQPPVIRERIRERVEKRIREQQMEWSVPDNVPQGQGQTCPTCRR